MAKVTDAFTTYNANTNKEDLANVIYNIDPADTPVISAIGKRQVSNQTFSWSTEGLPAVNSTPDIEGYTLSNASATAPTKNSNVTQIMHRDATVTKSQEASNMAGVGKNGFLAHSMALAAKALKRDMESAVCSAQARVDGEDSTPTARKTRGLEHWITTNVSTGASYSYTNATTAITDGTIRTFTQVLLEDALESGFSNGAEPSLMIVGPYTKRRISSFGGREGLQVIAKADELLNSFDVYKSDFGTLKVVPSRLSRSRTALILDPEFVKLAVFRDVEAYDIAVTGSAKTKVLGVEFGVEVSNEKAHIKVSDIPGTKAVDPSPLT